MPASINLSGLLSGSPAGLQDIIKQLQAAQTSANEANEKRYQDILGLYGNLGQAGMTRIGQQEQQAQAKSTQDLTSRGLGNTTVTGAMTRGIASDAELSRQQLQEGVAMQKAGVMERRTDQGPDMGMYASLIAGAAKQPSGNTTITRWSPATQAAFGGGSSGYGGLSDFGGGSGGDGGGGGGLPMGAGLSGLSTGGAGGAGSPAAAQGGFGDFGNANAEALSGGGTIFMGDKGYATNDPTFTPGLKEGSSIAFTPAAKKGRTYEEYKKTAGKNAVSAGYFASTGMGNW